MKKSLKHAIVVALAATAPLAALAQANTPAPATRVEVQHELVQLENAGYSPAGGNIDFPDGVQAAEARSETPARNAVTTTYGGRAAGSSAAGLRATPPAPAKSLYLDDADSLYVGD
ncbi:MAG TPA: DUF4148 domain-containing protein [Trinickia sp.]|nr:DUF4148 domain-containing protein [Trinickia sp.]